MAFALEQGLRTKPQKYDHVLRSAAEPRVWRFLAIALLLALFIVSLPYSTSILLKNDAKFRSDNEIGSIVDFQIKNKLNNYRFVYLEKLGQTEMKFTSRRLLAYESDAKKEAALKELEDVLLEPPRSSSRKSKRYLQRTRYLPDLMDDSLESYPRHVFIDVGLPEKDGGGGTSWFDQNYPTRNKKFEMLKIETVSTDLDPSSNALQIGVSDWLSNNVRAEDYVVMKAEAEVVEEMMKSKAVRLVDELFLECQPQRNGGRKVSGGGGRRPYWQCLALYGQLRDEGVAVHQWWG